MTTNDQSIPSIPSTDAERKAFKDALAEMTHCMRRMDDEREQLKDIAKSIQEKFNIKTKITRKLAVTMYKHDYASWQQEVEHFEFLYQTIIEGKNL